MRVRWQDGKGHAYEDEHHDVAYAYLCWDHGPSPPHDDTVTMVPLPPSAIPVAYDRVFPQTRLGK